MGLIITSWSENISGILIKHFYKTLTIHIRAEERGPFDAMDLLRRYQDKEIIQGYILYHPEENSELRDDMDFSYNIAESYAGVENAIIIDEALEPAIKELGYTKLLDARDISRNDYFDDLKDRKNRNLIVTKSPSFHNNIDFEKEGNFHSFVMSDGDNMQWTIGSFIDSRKFWVIASHGEFPIGFSSRAINLSLMAPDVLDELSRTQPEHTTIIE